MMRDWSRQGPESLDAPGWMDYMGHDDAAAAELGGNYCDGIHRHNGGGHGPDMRDLGWAADTKADSVVVVVGSGG